jgi:hypothetical protein
MSTPSGRMKMATRIYPTSRKTTMGSKKKTPDASRHIKATAGSKGTAARMMSLEKQRHWVKQPIDVRQSIEQLGKRTRSFHGAKFTLSYFRSFVGATPCADMFGYMTPSATRAATRLPLNATVRGLLEELGALMADPGREPAGSSTIPAGFTYVGQFVDHDITLDVSSDLEATAILDANSIPNMRSPSMDLDSVYGDGPALQPFLYDFPTAGPATAIKLKMGSNRNAGRGGPGGPAGQAGMVIKTDFDVPRAAGPASTAIIGDPRNDENLIVSQLHHAFLCLHNRIVDQLVAAGFVGDIFVEAKHLAIHHYQWAVVNDYLRRIAGQAAINFALNKVKPAVGSPFRMPVEFAVAAYRFGHSMVREQYWVNFNFPAATMAQVFDFIRPPNLPVLSNWVVDFNAFFQTGVAVPIFNNARLIDSVLTVKLEDLPGFTGIMKILATRNLRRGQVLGLPSGQGLAKHFKLKPLTETQLTQGLPPNEVAVLNKQNKLLLKRTPLWYYVLREAAVLGGGNSLGPVGARVVANTFIHILRRDGNSYLRKAGGFTPSLPSQVAGDFTFADLIRFTGVNLP